MKKTLVCMTVAMFFVMMPFVSFAKKAVTDGELDTLTAQEGVSIDFGTWNPAGFQYGDFAISNFSPALQSWGDADGFTSYTSSGWVGLSNWTSGGTINIGGVMTVDVGTNGSGVTAVQIGLPKVLVHPTNTSFTVTAGTTKQLNDGQEAFGTFYNDQFALLPNMNEAVGGANGSLTITNHSGASEGVDIAFGGTTGAVAPLVGGTGLLMALPATAIIQSWGDSDGFTGYTGAGYVGARNMTMSEPGGYFWIALSGSLSIDVGTNGSGSTAVQVGLPTTRMYTSGITQTLVLSDARELTGTQVLGTSFMGGLAATISPATMTISSHVGP